MADTAASSAVAAKYSGFSDIEKMILYNDFRRTRQLIAEAVRKLSAAGGVRAWASLLITSL